MESLKLYRPLVSNRVSQLFGANDACVTNHGAIVSTRHGDCPANSKPFYKSLNMDGHSGIDFAGILGEEVYHNGMYDGWMRTEIDSQGGIGVDVVSNTPVKLLDGREVYVKIRHWHLKSTVGFEGKQVKFGQVIGLAGSTGASSGVHDHLGLKVCDKNGMALEKGNGYFGAIDPMPYMNVTVDAKHAAKLLNVPPPPITIEEREDMLNQLSLMRIMLIQLLALIKRM